MSRHRRPRARTIARAERASRHRMEVAEALADGASLRLSNVTNIALGTVHAGTARALVKSGVAAYPDADREDGLPGRDLKTIVASRLTSERSKAP